MAVGGCHISSHDKLSLLAPIPSRRQDMFGSVQSYVYWDRTYRATAFLTVASFAVLDLVVINPIRDVRT